MSIKEKFFNQMMDNQFGKMTSEEKQKMMESMMNKFFEGMTEEEKKEMMKNMMPKMMGGMMGGSGNPMMGMMQMMMGKKGEGDGKMPWDRCMEMMNGFKETASTAKFSTPELRSLFEEWCSQIEKEILEFIKQAGKIEVKDLCEKLNLSEESVKYLLSKMAQKGLIDFKA